jgi:hypothetical protein
MRVAAVLEQMMQEFFAPLKGQDFHVRLAETLHPVAIAAPVKRRYDSELIDGRTSTTSSCFRELGDANHGRNGRQSATWPSVR